MEDREESRFYLSGGPLAAVLLGMALVPIRGFTTAANWTFVFLILTIAVAEFGGRGAAVATALASALSLDFFLTEPYMTLAIADKHDIIAFVGLLACGLSVAALGTTRARQIADLKVTRKHRELMSSVLSELTDPDPLEAKLVRILGAARALLPLAAMVVRDNAGRALAVTPGARATSPPESILQPELFLPGPSGGAARLDPPVPVEGARLALSGARGQVGWLDLWGTGVPLGTERRRTLADVARVLALLLAGAGTDARSQGGA